MKQQQHISKVTKKKLFDQSTPSKTASPINSSTSEFSPGTAFSETTSVSDLISSSSSITECVKYELVGASVDPSRFSGLKLDSIQEELLSSHGYELKETNDVDVDLMEADVVTEYLEVARRHVLQAKDLDLSSKKLLNRLIEVITSEEFCGLREEIGSLPDISSAKFPIMILILALFIIVASSSAVFFWTTGSRSSFNGPLPT